MGFVLGLDEIDRTEGPIRAPTTGCRYRGCPWRMKMRRVAMRQWELFGITDDDPYWTPPPVASRPIETIRFVPDLEDEDGVALVPEPAA